MTEQVAGRLAEAPRPDPAPELRLLLVVDSLDGGGAERHVVDLAGALRRRGHDVTVACSVGGVLADGLGAAGVPLRPLVGSLVKRRVSLVFAARLRRLVREGGFDLVHAHIYASAAAAALATARTGVPLVVTEHTEAPWRRRGARAFSRWLYGRPARIVAVSTAISRLLATGYGVHGDRLSVVVPAVLPQPPAAAPSGCAQDRLVGLVARLERSKGGDLFLRAAAQVGALVPAARFVVVGDGPQRGELERLAAQLGMADRVEFLGYRSDARRLIGSLDVLVVPSRTDGTPLVVLEAMAAGVPVVAAAVGGIPDQIRHDVDGLLVPPGDPAAVAGALAELLTDAERALRLAAAGRRRAAEFTHDAMVLTLETIYRSALGRLHQNLYRTGVV